MDLERFDHPEPLEPDSEAEKAFSQHQDKVKVVYTGAHGPANGLDVVIDAAVILSKQKKPVHFFLVGDGPEKTKLIEKAEKMGINNVSFLKPSAQISNFFSFAASGYFAALFETIKCF